MNQQAKISKSWHIGLWIVQILLAAMFLMGGSTVAFTPVEVLAPKMSFVNYYSPLAVKLIGLSEVVGALGLILPSLLRIKPLLTPLAALGLMTVMILAVIYHFNHGEAAGSGFPAVLGLIAAFVAWGRFKKAPISAKKQPILHSNQF